MNPESTAGNGSGVAGFILQRVIRPQKRSSAAEKDHPAQHDALTVGREACGRGGLTTHARLHISNAAG
jgi:hypothetical protein